MLVTLVRHRDHVAPPELQLPVLLGHEVVQGLDQELLWGHHLELDVLAPADARRPVVLHQLVQTVELHHPEEELALGVPEHLEVLDPVPALDAEGEVSGGTLTEVEGLRYRLSRPRHHRCP